MKKRNHLAQSVRVLTVMAIATTGMSMPAIAAPEIVADEGSLRLAQTSLTGQCRAAKQQIPIFRTADPTSEALRLLAGNEQVTLGDSAVDLNGFIGISAPVRGYVQAVNLKLCTGDSDLATVRPVSPNLCRQVARPPQGLLIRRQPSVTAALVDGVAYLGRVTLSSNPATTRKADGREWVEISSPARGWVSNGLDTQTESN